MGIPSEVGVGFRVRGMAVLARGLDSTTRIYADLNGVPKAISSATYSLYTSTGTALVDAAAVGGAPFTGTVIYTVPAASLPSTIEYGTGYREVWALTLADASVVRCTRPAAVARYPIQCPITHQDVTAPYPAMSSDLRDPNGTIVQGFIDDAWVDLLRKMQGEGRWADAVVDVDALIEPLTHMALERVWRFIYSTLRTPESKDLAELHERKGSTSYRTANWRVDKNQDGVADSATREPGVAMIRMNVGPGTSYPAPGRRVF